MGSGPGQGCGSKEGGLWLNPVIDLKMMIGFISGQMIIKYV